MLIEEYEKTLIGLASTNSDFVFNNSGIDHAAIFTKTIYTYATKIKMLCNGLGSELAKDKRYLDALQAFLDRANTELTLIIISKSHLKGAALKMIQKKVVEFPERFKIFHAPTESGFSYSSHIMIGDGCIFRIENEPETFKAFGSFNKPSIVDKLNNILDNILNQSIQISPST